jgi:hypothetical protein
MSVLMRGPLRSFRLIWKILKPLFFGVPEKCSWPTCPDRPEYICVFTDGHVEPRCRAHHGMNATPER